MPNIVVPSCAVVNLPADDLDSSVLPFWATDPADEAHEIGRAIGLEGGRAYWFEVRPDSDPDRDRRLIIAFHRGRYEGYREYARSLGYRLGSTDQPKRVPESMDPAFFLAFVEGYTQGMADLIAERDRIMREEFAYLDWLDRNAEELAEQYEWADRVGSICAS